MACLLWSSAAFAQSVDWPRIEVTPLVSGLSQPTHITDAGDGSNRLFVVEQRGTISLFENGSLLATPFLDIRDRVLFGGERGLLSVAFPPNFNDTQHFYVYYTGLTGNVVISRFAVTDDPDVADARSEAVVIGYDHSSFSNHNGGQLAFGPDGYLYIGTGDGGGGGDPLHNGQNHGVILGKMLRIDVESGVDPYSVPPDNPFVGVEGYRPEIWGLGMRNPWRYPLTRKPATCTSPMSVRTGTRRSMFSRPLAPVARTTGGTSWKAFIASARWSIVTRRD